MYSLWMPHGSRSLRLPSCAALLLGFTSCATIFAPGPDRVQVSSSTRGARVFIDNMEVGTTPMTVALDRKIHQGVIKVEAPGYAPYTTQRAKEFNPVAILNCLGLLPWVVDLATGNHQKFDTTPVNATFTAPYGTQASAAWAPAGRSWARAPGQPRRAGHPQAGQGAPQPSAPR
jgi:hypothetical protein